MTLIQHGRPVSSFHLPFDSEYPQRCLVGSSGPFDIVIHDQSCGYALLSGVSFTSGTIELGDIEWKPGAKVLVDVSLDGLDAFPDTVSMRHEKTGLVFSEDIFLEKNVEFANLPPGKWIVEVTGNDPLVGKKSLFVREVVVTQSEEFQLKLRKSD